MKIIDVRNKESEHDNVIEIIFGENDKIVYNKENPKEVSFYEGVNCDYYFLTEDIDNLIKALEELKKHIKQ